MRESAWFLAGLCSGTFICMVNLWDEPGKNQVGYTYQQLTEMKAECEKDLPRSTECNITVYYLPQAEQSEEVE